MSLFLCYNAIAADRPSLLGDDDASTLSSAPQSSSAAQDDDDSLFSFLGIKIPKYISTSSKEKDQNSIDIVTQKAEDGDVASQLRLGYSYLYGQDGVDIDYAKSFHFYEMAAKAEDKIGLNNLGSLYYNGIGVKRSPKIAAELFARSAKLGNIDAATNLGFMYISGNGITKDIPTGLEYLEQAASQGNVLAGYIVGYAYYQGTYRPRNYHTAATLIKKAADAGLDEAQVAIANMYTLGLGYPQNYNMALAYLQKAFNQGNLDAMMKLADIYSGKTKYPANLASAHVVYNLASVRGVKGASQILRQIEHKLKIEEVIAAQEEASRYVEKPSSLTTYVKQTYGANLQQFLLSPN